MILKRKIFETLLNGKVIIIVAIEVVNHRISLNTHNKGILNLSYVYADKPNERVDSLDAVEAFKKLSPTITKWADKHNLGFGII